MEKKSVHENNTYLALYHLRANKKNQPIAYRSVWAQRSIAYNGEVHYKALADTGWKSSEGKCFDEYSPREIYNLLTSDYIGFDNARNNELLKKYVTSFS